MIEVVVAPVLQSKDPVEMVDNLDVPLQLSMSVTTGAEGAPGALLTIMFVAADKQPLLDLSVTATKPGATPVNTPVVLV